MVIGKLFNNKDIRINVGINVGVNVGINVIRFGSSKEKYHE